MRKEIKKLFDDNPHFFVIDDIANVQGANAFDDDEFTFWHQYERDGGGFTDTKLHFRKRDQSHPAKQWIAYDENDEIIDYK